MYTPTIWKDRVVQRPKTYTIQNNSDGTSTLTEAPGEIIQQGTPLNASAFTNIENGIELIFDILGGIHDLIHTIALSGVKEFGDNLKVLPGAGLVTHILPGSAVVNGYLFKRDEPTIMTHEPSEGNPRIDRVVLQLNMSSDPVEISIAVLQGDSAETPTPPQITRQDGIFELSLAQVYIEADATTLQVTDERADEDVCGAISPAALRLSVISQMISDAVGQALGPNSTPTFNGASLTDDLDMNGKQIINAVFG